MTPEDREFLGIADQWRNASRIKSRTRRMCPWCVVALPRVIFELRWRMYFDWLTDGKWLPMKGASSGWPEKRTAASGTVAHRTTKTIAMVC